MPEPAVRVRDLSRTFGSFRAVDRITFEVAQGEVFGFLGPNGAGKSTTIRMLCGLLRPTGGSGAVAGFDIATQPDQVKHAIGYMSQRFALYDDLTVRENIDFVAGIYGVPPADLAARRDTVLAMADLSGRESVLTRELSSGWKQRLALGASIVHSPGILFLDEPTSGVDPLGRRRFWDLIYQTAASGVTVFVTTHYMEEAEHCDRLALIYRGRIQAIGTSRELKDEMRAMALYEIDAAPLLGALPCLEGAPGVHDAGLHGARIRAIVDRASVTAADLGARMAGGGVVVRSIEPVEPTLEDVFVSLIERADRAEAQR